MAPQHRPRLMEILRTSDAASPPLALLLMRDFHGLLHFSNDRKLQELRSRPETISGLGAKVQCVSGGDSEAAASALEGLSDFAAYVFVYLSNTLNKFDPVRDPDDEAVADAKAAFEVAGSALGRLAADGRRRGRAHPGLDSAQAEVDRRSGQYKAAVAAHSQQRDVQLVELLALLTEPKDELTPSRLGELVLSASGGRGLAPVLQLASRVLPAEDGEALACPLWLPAKVLDLALDMIADAELEPQLVADWIKASLPSLGRSLDAEGTQVATATRLVQKSIRAWEHALRVHERRNTLAYLCLRLPMQRDGSIDLLDCAVLLMRMYFCAPAAAAVRSIGETLNLLLRRSVEVAATIVETDRPNLQVRAVDALLTFWSEALRPHAGCAAPVLAQAYRVLSEFPKLFSELFLCVVDAALPSATAVWAHLTTLLDLGADEPRMKSAAQWLAASVVKTQTELSRTPAFIDLAAQPRSSQMLTETPAWQAMLRAATPLVPDTWYEDARQSRPTRGQHGLISDADTYASKVQLAQAELEAQAAAEAQAKREAQASAEQKAQAERERQNKAAASFWSQKLEEQRILAEPMAAFAARPQVDESGDLGSDSELAASRTYAPSTRAESEGAQELEELSEDDLEKLRQEASARLEKAQPRESILGFYKLRVAKVDMAELRAAIEQAEHVGVEQKKIEQAKQAVQQVDAARSEAAEKLTRARSAKEVGDLSSAIEQARKAGLADDVVGPATTQLLSLKLMAAATAGTLADVDVAMLSSQIKAAKAGGVKPHEIQAATAFRDKIQEMRQEASARLEKAQPRESVLGLYKLRVAEVDMAELRAAIEQAEHVGVEQTRRGQKKIEQAKQAMQQAIEHHSRLAATTWSGDGADAGSPSVRHDADVFL